MIRPAPAATGMSWPSSRDVPPRILRSMLGSPGRVSRDPGVEASRGSFCAYPYYPPGTIYPVRTMTYEAHHACHRRLAWGLASTVSTRVRLDLYYDLGPLRAWPRLSRPFHPGPLAARAPIPFVKPTLPLADHPVSYAIPLAGMLTGAGLSRTFFPWTLATKGNRPFVKHNFDLLDPSILQCDVFVLTHETSVLTRY